MRRLWIHSIRVLLGVFAAIELVAASLVVWLILSSSSGPSSQILALAFTWLLSATIAGFTFFSERAWPRVVGMMMHGLTIGLGLISLTSISGNGSKHSSGHNSLGGLEDIIVAVFTLVPILVIIAVAALGLFLLAILPKPIPKEQPNQDQV